MKAPLVDLSLLQMLCFPLKQRVFSCAPALFRFVYSGCFILFPYIALYGRLPGRKYNDRLWVLEGPGQGIMGPDRPRES